MKKKNFNLKDVLLLVKHFYETGLDEGEFSMLAAAAHKFHINEKDYDDFCCKKICPYEQKGKCLACGSNDANSPVPFPKISEITNCANRNALSDYPKKREEELEKFEYFLATQLIYENELYYELELREIFDRIIMNEKNEDAKKDSDLPF